MNNQTLLQIQSLSLADKKSLSQKVLKATEELGDLAKFALSYDDAYATKHRFVTREKILEETADTILCVMSVAYSLGYTTESIEQMLVKKMDKWKRLQQIDDNSSKPLWFEVHITVQPNTQTDEEFARFVDRFKSVCMNLAVKPIIIDLQTKNAAPDVMTSCRFKGTNAEVSLYVETLVTGLREAGLHVVRAKIETVPWHPAAQLPEADRPKGAYFESHCAITITESQLQLLVDEVTRLQIPGLHLSRNAQKRYPDGKMVQMVTIRRLDGTLEQFQNAVDQFIKQITPLCNSHGWTIGKVEVEYAIHDTNLSHDTTWTSSKRQ